MNRHDLPRFLPFGKVITDDLLEDGASFGGYTVESLLTVTLLGAFYLVRESESGKLYTLQVVPDGLNRDATLEPNLKQMVNSVRAVSHAALCKPLSVMRIQEHLCVLYEGEEGITLSRYVLEKAAHNGLTEDEAKYVFGSVAGALGVLDPVGVHHFSITPEFILMGARGNVRLLGVGFFQCVDPRRFEIFVSSAIKPISGPETDTYFSTLEVFAPEVRNGYNGDWRSDVFSIGLCLYFVLTGNKPEQQWVLPSVARAGLSEGWDTFVSACLEADPANRFSSAGAFVEFLGKAERFHLGKGDRGGLLGRKLERIPLPKSVTRKYSEGIQYRIRVALLCVFGVVVLGLGALSLSILYDEDSEVPQGPPVREVAGQGPVSLELTVSPARATVTFGRSGTTTIVVDNGLLRVQAPRGTYRVRVDAPSHVAQNFLIELGSTTVYRSVELLPEWARFSVSGPVGAMVYLIGGGGGPASFLDRIPDGGVLEVSERVLAGSYTVEVRMDGFETAVFADVDLRADEPTNLDAVLNPLPATVVVETDPPGIPVMLDGERMGVTPLELSGIVAGMPHALEVGGGAFEIRRRDIELEPGEHRMVSFGRIEELTGQLTVRVRLPDGMRGEIAPADLSVFIGDKRYSSGDAFTLDLPVGVHTARVEHPDYFPEEVEVIVTDTQPSEIVVEMNPRPVLLKVSVPGNLPYTLLLGDTPIAPNADGLFELEALRPYDFRLMVRDHLILSRNWEFAPNETVEWVPDLRPIPAPDKGRDFLVPYTDLKLRWVQPGTFQLGSPLSEELRTPNEDEPTKVTLTRGFWIGVYEMDQATYRRIMGNNPSRFAGNTLPVENVSWDDAMALCERLTRREREAGRLPAGYVYRLPTEAEWEYAARAGTRTPFAFGSSATPDNANFRGCYPPQYGATTGSDSDLYGTRPVGSYAANAWGLYDMHGNVREWVFDKYNDRHPGGSTRDHVNLTGQRGRVLKGGGWEDFAHRSRSAARDRASESTRSASLGFRVVLAPAQ